MMRKIAIAAAGAACALALAAPAAFAQSIGSIGTTDPFTISTSPDYPAPYGQVTVTPGSTLIDLAAATFTISVAGTQVYSGNAKPVAVTLGGAGALTTIKTTLVAGGATYTQSVSIRPQDVALVAEPLSSAPPLYPGKPLIPLEGNTRIVAVANLRTGAGAALNPKSLSYAWSVDGGEITASSGIGQNSIIVPSPLEYRQSDVSVLVTSADGSYAGGDSLVLNPQEPTVRVYDNDPLLGIRFDNALFGSYTIPGAEDSLYGAAYSFPLTSGAPVFQWFLNGASAQTGNSITLRPTGAGSGSASLSLTAAAGDTSENAALSLIFGGTSSTNIFGL